jgi:hypothetical protein
MKTNILIIILTCVIISAGCDGPAVKSGVQREALISKGFIDDNAYRVVCRGYPQEGLAGVQQAESAKRAALLSAYYFIKRDFTDAVRPDKDGSAEKFDLQEDHAVVYYMVRKKGLKKMVRKISHTEPEPKPVSDVKPVPKPEPVPDVKPEPKPDPVNEQKTELKTGQ